MTNVAVLDKGWLGGGNTGRNTTIIRSNYLWEESEAIYEHALRLWEGLSRELNYNVMYSARGVMMLAHNIHDVQVFKRHMHANRLAGIDNEWLTPEAAKAFCPILNTSKKIRHPIVGAAAAAARWNGASRRGRLGLRPRRFGARRGHRPKLRSEGNSTRRVGRSLRGRDQQGVHRDEEDRRRRGWSHFDGDGDGRGSYAAGELSTAGAGFGTGQADDAMRRDVEHGSRLHVAVRQGRAGHRRRHGRLYILFADRRTAHRHSHARGDLRIVPDGPAHAHVAQLGRDRRRGGSWPSDACFSVETIGRGAPPAGGGILGDCTPAGRAHAKSFVDFQNDVCADDIRLAVREGMRSIEHVKRYTTTGMATDQGKLSNMNALAIVRGRSISRRRRSA